MNRLDVASVLMFGVLSTALGIHLLPVFGWGSFVALALGYFFADFIGGFVHWLADSWEVKAEGAIRRFIIPFRHHHKHPEAMTKNSFWVTNGHNCLISLPVLTLGLLLAPGFGGTFILAAGMGVLLTNQAHKWAHTQDPGVIVTLLQRAGLVLSPARHAPHHSGSNNGSYCVTSGILNGPLDRFGFFRKLESLVTRLTGLVPRNNAP